MLLAENPSRIAATVQGLTRSTDYPALTFEPSFRAFATQRVEVLAVLEPLTPNEWSRSATVNRSGKVLTETVRSFAERLASHERHHLDQFGRIAEAMRRLRESSRA